jgi:preprotein translocase subunit SecE
VARNRQRNRTPRPDSRADPARADPLFPAAGGGDEDLDAASQAFGKADPVVAAEMQRPSGNRIIGFLRASWAELQRVQWPDRQQVAQATGVVLGFVVITGIFLGVADYLAGKLINFII